MTNVEAVMRTRVNQQSSFASREEIVALLHDLLQLRDKLFQVEAMHATQRKIIADSLTALDDFSQLDNLADRVKAIVRKLADAERELADARRALSDAGWSCTTLSDGIGSIDSNRLYYKRLFEKNQCQADLLEKIRRAKEALQ